MIRIVKAKKDDAMAIVALQQKVWQEAEVSNIYEIAEFIRYGLVYVAKDKGRIVGVIVAFCKRQGGICVEDFVVDDEYRNKGIGYRLYQALLKYAPRPVVTLLRPDYDASIHLHERLGFHKIQTVYRPYSSDNKNEKMLMYRLER